MAQRAAAVKRRNRPTRRSRWGARSIEQVNRALHGVFECYEIHRPARTDLLDGKLLRGILEAPLSTRSGGAATLVGRRS